MVNTSFWTATVICSPLAIGHALPRVVFGRHYMKMTTISPFLLIIPWYSLAFSTFAQYSYTSNNYRYSESVNCRCLPGHAEVLKYALADWSEAGNTINYSYWRLFFYCSASTPNSKRFFRQVYNIL